MVPYTAVIHRDAQNICWNLCEVLLLAKNQHKEKTDSPKGAMLCLPEYMLMSLANIPLQ